MSPGLVEIMLMAGPWSENKTNLMDQSINRKPLIDGLLIRKLFLRHRKRLFILLNQKPRLGQECLPSIEVQYGTSSC